MIRESIVTTRRKDGSVHIAPMGVHVLEDGLMIAPFKPSSTLENITREQCAVINYPDDVRIYAGCLTGRRDWAVCPADKIDAMRLQNCLAHTEVIVDRVEEDEQRPRFICRIAHEASHAPFLGFNRAQAAVIELAILVTRLHMLPWQKIQDELSYLQIAIDKTAGHRELEAWGWLMEKVEAFQNKSQETNA